MDTLPCSCGGENSNCFKCYGTGLVPSAAGSLGRPKSAATLSPSSAKSGIRKRAKLAQYQKRPSIPPDGLSSGKPFKPVSAKTYCPICLQVIPTGTLRFHRRRAHPTAQELLANPASSEPKQLKVKPSQVTCPLCNCSVRRLDKHIHKAHRDAMPDKDRRSLVVSLSSKACSKCQFTSEDMPTMFSHLLKSHGLATAVSTEKKRVPVERAQKATGRKSNNSKAQREGSRAPEGGTRPRHGSHDRDRLSQEAQSQQLDAKYAWGGTYRDNGSFGSYPSHDSMDDESSP